MRRAVLSLLCATVVGLCLDCEETQAQERAYSRTWGHSYSAHDWERFYHYPYVFYPQNYYGNEYYRSNGSLYNRYPQEMRVPVYNKQWHNYYPEGRRYHWGNHFETDVY